MAADHRRPASEYTFDIVVSAIGMFTQPVMPDLVEEEPFTGTLMHTARWDHSVDLRNARVAVLGTGSTAAQLVPEVAKVAAKVYSVQRSPTWVLPKPDRPYTEREKWLFAHVPLAKKIYRTRLWLRSESNISVIENGSDKTQEFKGIALRTLESTIPDEELRSRLTPDTSVRMQAAGVRHRLSADADPAARRGGVQSGPQRCGRGRWSPRTAPNSTSTWCCARRVTPLRTTWGRSTSGVPKEQRCTTPGATGRSRTWA